MIRVYFKGAGFGNKGAEAMTRVVIAELRRRFGVVEFCAKLPKWQWQNARNVGVTPFNSEDLVEKFIAGIARRVNYHPILRQIYTIKDVRGIARRKCNVLMDISGFSYLGRWGLLPLETAHKRNVAFVGSGGVAVYLPQTWGEFETEDLKNAARDLLNTSSYAFARDRRSYESLVRICGTDRVGCAPDIAFLLSEAPPRQLAATKVMLVCPNAQIVKRTAGKGIGNSYVQALAKLVDHATCNMHLQVTLAPHQISVNPKEDDRKVVQAVAALCKKHERVNVVLDDLSAAEIRNLIRSAEIVVSSRFHACVGALAEARPVMAVGWAHKYEELLRDFELSCFTTDYKESNWPDAGIEKLNALWYARYAVSSSIMAKLPLVRESLGTVFGTIEKCIRACLKNSHFANRRSIS